MSYIKKIYILTFLLIQSIYVASMNKKLRIKIVNTSKVDKKTQKIIANLSSFIQTKQKLENPKKLTKIKNNTEKTNLQIHINVLKLVVEKNQVEIDAASTFMKKLQSSEKEKIQYFKKILQKKNNLLMNDVVRTNDQNEKLKPILFLQNIKNYLLHTKICKPLLVDIITNEKTIIKKVLFKVKNDFYKYSFSYDFATNLNLSIHKQSKKELIKNTKAKYNQKGNITKLALDI